MRALDTLTLDVAANHYATEFLRPDMVHGTVEGKFIGGRSYVLQDFQGFMFKDEFEYLLGAIRDRFGSTPLQEFDKLASVNFAPRDDDVFERLLAEKLAVNPAGEHIVGRVGPTKVGSRVIGFRAKTINTRKGERVVAKNLYWPVYAGETEERVLEAEADMGTGEGGVVHPLPLHAQPMAVGALNTRISNEVALLMADACVDNLDEGSAGAVIQGRTGAQPADPDTAVSGTNLFTLTCNTTAFGAAADAAPGGIATAAAITDDSSADATGTLGYCRASSSNAADTPLDDHIDGEAGTSGADFNFNTLAIVSGATVSMTSWTVTMPET